LRLAAMNAVSLSEMAVILGVSEPTLRRRLADAPPSVILKRGTHGDAYEIDPHAAAAWWQALKSADDAEAAQRRDRISALQLELLGDDAALADANLGTISATEQRAALEAELAAIKLGKERGELVRADEVLARLSEFMQATASSFTDLPVKLSRRVEVPPEVLAMLNTLTNQALNTLANLAANIGSTYGSNSDADAPAAPDRPVPPA
jgi:hypothetical protein